MPINVLTDEIVRGADRTHVWFNTILGYCIVLSIPYERTWWTNPMFGVARSFPHSQLVWGGSLAVATTIYVLGSFRGYGKPHRGTIIIVGASLCFVWYFVFCMALARQTYVDPQHCSSLWPLLIFFFALLYAHRAVLYFNTFTGVRWSLNPFQLYAVTFLMLLSVTEVVIGVSPSSVQAQFDKNTQLSLAGANFVGGVVVMAGLHLRDIERGLWIELWGYASLTASLLFYVFATQHSVQVPIATLGFALSEAFAFASLHRAIQIGVYKWGKRSDPEMAEKIRPHLFRDRDTTHRLFHDQEEIGQKVAEAAQEIAEEHQ